MLKKHKDPKAQLNHTRRRVAMMALTLIVLATAIPYLLIEGII